MLIFWKERLVLLAVPKTGTTALEQALLPRSDVAFLNPPALKHLNVDQLNGPFARLFRPYDPTDFQFVGVMRDPVEWLRSWHRYRSRSVISGTDRSTENVDFNSFVRAYLSDSRPAYARVGSQARFLQGKENLHKNTVIFDYARLSQLHHFLEGQLGLSFQVDFKNVSPRMEDQNLDPATQLALETAYPQDFELYQRVSEQARSQEAGT